MLAREAAAELQFVHVSDDASQADSVLCAVTGIARRAGVDGEEVSIPAHGDSVADVILHEAARWHADLIVVGSHGRDGMERLLFGSISEAIAGAANIPVLVVRQPVLGMLTG